MTRFASLLIAAFAALELTTAADAAQRSRSKPAAALPR